MIWSILLNYPIKGGFYAGIFISLRVVFTLV